MIYLDLPGGNPIGKNVREEFTEHTCNSFSEVARAVYNWQYTVLAMVNFLEKS